MSKTFYELDTLMTGDLKKIQKALNENQVYINEADTDYQNTLLHLAAKNGYRDICEFLINEGADVNAKNILGETPFHCAARNKYEPEILDLFLEQQCDPFLKDNRGFSPALNNEYVSEILNRPNRLWNLLYDCVLDNDIKSIKEILAEMSKSDIDKTINQCSADGRTLLHIAVSSKDPTIAQELLKAGADPNIKSNKGKTSLEYSNPQCALVLKEANAINLPKKTEITTPSPFQKMNAIGRIYKEFPND